MLQGMENRGNKISGCNPLIYETEGEKESSPENREGKENNNSIIALNIVRNCFQHYPPPFLRHHTNVTVSSIYSKNTNEEIAP